MIWQQEWKTQMKMLEVGVVLLVLAIAVLSVAVGAKDLTNKQRGWTAVFAAGMSLTASVLCFLSTR